MQAPPLPPGSTRTWVTPIRRQRGSMAIAMMLMLLGLITILGIVEVGYLYWAHRDAQKVADLAALSGAQQLPDCTAATTAANNNATTDNSFKGTPVITCGSWGGGASPNSVAPASSSTAATNTGVKVVAQMPLTPFFGFAKFSGTNATAVAANTGQVAAFSVGTTLVNVDGSATLPQLLQGIGINLDGTNLVGYQGLANVNITPAGLLKQLGIPVTTAVTVGDLNALLDKSTVSAGQLLNAIATLAGQDGLVDASATTLWGALGISAETPGDIALLTNVPLGGPGGLFAQIVAPDVQAALNAQVNALQLLATAIGVGTGKHAVGTDTNLNLGLLNITASTSVIEPPSIGIGGIGTTAYTAQVRTFIHITTPSLQSIPLLGGLISLDVNLPIAIDLVDAQGKLTGLCDTTDSTTGQPQATIAVDSSLLKMCVGNMTQADAFSTVGGCDQIPGANTPLLLLGLSAAGANLASLNTSFSTNALSGGGSVTLSAGQTGYTGNKLPIGTTVNNLVTALTTALIAQTSSSGTPTQTANQTATDLWNSIAQGRNNASKYGSQFGTWRQQAIDQVQSSAQGLQGLLGNEAGQISDILGNTLTLNVPGLVDGVTGLVSNLTTSLANLLKGIIGGGCTPALLSSGNYQECISDISNAMSPSSTSNDAFIGLLGFLLQTLQPALDSLGSSVLTPLLQNTLGINLGQTTVNLQSLQCHSTQLVY